MCESVSKIITRFSVFSFFFLIVKLHKNEYFVCFIEVSKSRKNDFHRTKTQTRVSSYGTFTRQCIIRTRGYIIRTDRQDFAVSLEKQVHAHLRPAPRPEKRFQRITISPARMALVYATYVTFRRKLVKSDEGASAALTFIVSYGKLSRPSSSARVCVCIR